MTSRHTAQPGTRETRRSVTLARSWGFPRDTTGLPQTTRLANQLPSHARRLGGSRVRRGVGMALTAVLAFTGSTVVATALGLTSNIASVDTDKALAAIEEDRPEAATPDPADPHAGVPLNILIMGTDDRSGDNEGMGGYVEGIRSDSTLIMHVSADRKQVAMVSIPRDSTVNIPRCVTTAGTTTAPIPNARFNAAFAVGYDVGGDVESGALCAMTTVEQLTNIRIDGFVVLDFIGFRNMVDALGGVEMCIPQDVYSEKADHLTLTAGWNLLDGTTALQYARARTGQGLGDGSDLGRIGRQQEMMAAMAREVLSKNLLTDSPALLSFLGATTSSMTMSSNFASITGLSGLAFSLRNVRPDTISFLPVPFTTDPNDPNAVVWTPEAEELWASLRTDRWENPNAPADAPLTDSPATADGEPGGPAESGSATATNADNVAIDPGTGVVTTPTPTSSPVREAGREVFTAADTTSVCG